MYKRQVWNGLTNEFHPTQLLADLMTMQEHLPGKAFNEMTLVYAGDARNNMGNSMLEAAALTGLDLRLLAPKACWPEESLVAECSALAEKHGGKITLTEDVAAGVKGADFIYTDVWGSMGEAKEKWAEPVSYTHLDVYKRQVLRRAFAIICWKNRVLGFTSNKTAPLP